MPNHAFKCPPTSLDSNSRVSSSPPLASETRMYVREQPLVLQFRIGKL